MFPLRRHSYVLWSFFLLRLLCISIKLPYAHAWNTVVTSELVPQLLLGIVRQSKKTNMQNCWSFTCCFSWTIGSSLKCGQLKSFLCFSELAQLVLLLFSRGRFTRYSDRLHDFSITVPRCYKDVYVNSFFPRTARPWNSLPIVCFPLTYDLNGFKSRINWHLLTVGFF